MQWKEGPRDLHTAQVHLAFKVRLTAITLKREAILLWLVVAVALATAFLLYRSRQSRLYVTPDAQHEIDKAKRR